MDVAALEQRVERLEQANRRLKTGVLALAAVVAGFVCLAATEPAAKVVRAERFEMVSPEGVARAVLGPSSYGSPGLQFNDRNGKLRVVLGVVGDTPHLHLLDTDDKTRIALSVDTDGSPVPALNGPDGKPQALFGVLDDGSLSLVLSHGQSKAAAVLGVLADGSPWLDLNDANGKMRATFSLRADGSPVLALCDQYGRVLWNAP